MIMSIILICARERRWCNADLVTRQIIRVTPRKRDPAYRIRGRCDDNASGGDGDDDSGGGGGGGGCGGGGDGGDEGGDKGGGGDASRSFPENSCARPLSSLLRCCWTFGLAWTEELKRERKYIQYNVELCIKHSITIN